MRYKLDAVALQTAVSVWIACLSLAVFGLGCRGEAHPVVSRHVKEVNPEEASIVAEIENLGGEVTVDQGSGEKSVIDVRLTCCNVTDAWLDRLKGLTRLQSLSLNGTNVTDAGLKRLEGMKSLQDLSLYDTLVTDAGLEYLKALPSLQVLNLRGTDPATNRPGSPKTYSSLGLRRPDSGIRQPGTVVTDAGLEHLQGLIGLQWLSLSASGVTDAGLRHIGGLTNLATLDLDDTSVGDAGLEHLKGLAKLQDLRLFNTKVTDAGLEHLKGMTSLQWLDLGSSFGPRGNTEVTDTGLEHLKGLTNLFHLGLWGTKVSAEGVKKLHQALPNCGIDSPDGEIRAVVPGHRELIPGTHYWRRVPTPVGTPK